MTLRIGFDIDDVVHPWYATAHHLCTRAGVTHGVRPTSWYPYEEYGITRKEWWEVLHQGTIGGDLYFAPEPSVEATFAISHLRAQIHVGALPKGTTLVAITARGETFAHDETHPWMRDLIQEQTHLWLHQWALEFDEVIFTSDKGAHELDYLIDDSAGNVRSVIAHGGAGFLLDKTWNRRDVDLPRIETINDYVEAIMGDQ